MRRSIVKQGGGASVSKFVGNYSSVWNKTNMTTMNAQGAGRYNTPWNAYIGHMLKDVGGKLTQVSHKMQSNRLMYPTPRHQNLKVYRHMIPDYHLAGFVAPTACVTGNVTLGQNSNVMYHSCIRNYHTRASIMIGDNTSILERSTLIGHVNIGNDSIVGVGSTLDCCEVHNNVHIGSRCHIALGSIIENGAILASGSVVPKDTRVPAGEIWAGNPAEKVGMVTDEQVSEISHLVEDYKAIGAAHKKALEIHEIKNSAFDLEWLRSMCKQIESRQNDIKIAHASEADIPIDARQFMQPRVVDRRPTNQNYVTYPVNAVAPWLPRQPDWAGNV